MAVYKDSKRGTWYVLVYYTNWKGESDRKMKRGFKTRKDAVAWENTFLNSVICFQELDRTTSEFLSNYMGKDFINALPTLKPRTAIAMGKAFRSTTPMMFEVPIIDETKQ